MQHQTKISYRKASSPSLGPIVLFHSVSPSFSEEMEATLPIKCITFQGKDLLLNLEDLSASSIVFVYVKNKEALGDIDPTLSSKARLGLIVSSYDEFFMKQKITEGFSHFYLEERPLNKQADCLLESLEYPSYIDPFLQNPLLTELQSLIKRETQEPENLQIRTDKASTVLRPTEVKILAEVLKGKSNTQIAKDCYLALSTVNNHVSQSSKKMKANNRFHMIKRAIEFDWVE
ncbi:helix-turn-helix domain-containing protein [Salsuginibacillus kocurii]|uniref:helix-turn-helix domain-containing protein n=1 Tax=Salsuginibacillus kocurii TaxID=427078 RepID=UPI000363DF30|nr:LuxR C-terminal-related transcriptional regulator [Salsuginibacillus kocurii]